MSWCEMCCCLTATRGLQTRRHSNTPLRSHVPGFYFKRYFLHKNLSQPVGKIATFSGCHFNSGRRPEGLGCNHSSHVTAASRGDTLGPFQFIHTTQHIHVELGDTVCVQLNDYTNAESSELWENDLRLFPHLLSLMFYTW